MHYTRHLKLQRVYNTRDLGGYSNEDGGTTRFGVFLRSDAPCELPEEDVQALLDYGVTASMDLRSDGERASRPSSLRDSTTYYEKPLFAQAAILGAKSAHSPDDTWLERYIDMAESSQAWAVEALRIAAGNEGCLLFHCTTGKDRTGLLSCYLLSIAGVSREDIAADYCISELFLGPVYQRMIQGKMNLDKTKSLPPISKEKLEAFFRTPAEAMLGLIDYLTEKYGSVVGYLLQAGVPEETISAIREKLVED